MTRAADPHTGSERGVVVDSHVVWQHDLRHHHDVPPDDGVGGQVDVGEQHAARADVAGRPDRGRRMHDRRVALVGEPEALRDQQAADVIVGTAGREDDHVALVLERELDRTEHGNAADRRPVPVGVVVEEAAQAPGGRHGVDRAHRLGGLPREAA